MPVSSMLANLGEPHNEVAALQEWETGGRAGGDGEVRVVGDKHVPQGECQYPNTYMKGALKVFLYNQACHIDNPAPANTDAGELLSQGRTVCVF